MTDLDSHLPSVSALVHFETCAKIEDKKKRLVTPKTNIFQRRLYEAYETLLSIAISLNFDFKIRILGLKIRQCGGTTASCHILYHHSQRFPTDSVVITDVNPNSQEVLTKMKRYAQTDRFDWRNPLDPKETKLVWKNGSRAEITSAMTPNAGISRTRQAALFSEACKYPRGGVKDDKAIMAGVLPSVNLLGIAESTPEGASGWFYDQWQSALTLDEFIAALKRGELKPGNGWVKVFAAWFEFLENARQLTEAEAINIRRSLTQREQNGTTKYGWTLEQVAWRRDTMASECGKSEELFDEYYPEDEVTCFLSSGRPRFNMASILRMERMIRTYDVSEGHLDSQAHGITFVPDSSGHGTIQVFEPPREGCRYLVWCDPATGEDQTESRDPDRHSIGVLRAPYAERDGLEKKLTVAARVKAPCTSGGDTVAQHIINLSRLYGDAMVVLEINMGLHVLKELKDAGVPIYKREIIDPYDRDTPKLMYGWKLKDRDQRRGVVDCLAAHIRDMTIEIPCSHILGECKTFIIDKNGKEQARSGTHDDDVMGLAMGCYCIGAATPYRVSLRRKRKPLDHKKWKRK